MHDSTYMFYLFVVAKGSALQKYPALLSMAAMMEILGSMQVAVVGVAYEGVRCLDLRLLTMDQLTIILYGVSLTLIMPRPVFLANVSLSYWLVKNGYNS